MLIANISCRLLNTLLVQFWVQHKLCDKMKSNNMGKYLLKCRSIQVSEFHWYIPKLELFTWIYPPNLVCPGLQGVVSVLEDPHYWGCNQIDQRQHKTWKSPILIYWASLSNHPHLVLLIFELISFSLYLVQRVFLIYFEYNKNFSLPGSVLTATV